MIAKDEALLCIHTSSSDKVKIHSKIAEMILDEKEGVYYLFHNSSALKVTILKAEFMKKEGDVIRYKDEAGNHFAFAIYKLADLIGKKEDFGLKLNQLLHQAKTKTLSMSDRKVKKKKEKVKPPKGMAGMVFPQMESMDD